MSGSTGLPSNSTTLHDVVPTLPLSSEEKSARTLAKKKREDEEFIVVEAEDPDVDLEYPDGGWRAWGVVVGAACTILATFGYINAWGAFQEYYQIVKFPDQSPSSIAWIGSLQGSLIFVPGIVGGRLFDSGYFRLPFMIANGVLLLVTFLVAECETFWQIVLCQGILTGFACGIMFAPIIALTSQWFDKRRQLVFGLIAIGASVGGAVIPILVRDLLPSVGFQWTMRILGFFLLGITAISNALLRRRLPPRKATGRLINFTQFKNIAFCVYTLASVIVFLGLYTVLTYIATYATERGTSESMGDNLVAIANASSFIGYFLTGLLGDKFGPLNTMIPLTLLAGISTYAWPFTSSLQAIIPVTVLYGISSSAFPALTASPVIRMGEFSSVGERTGLLFTFAALGALAGPPISGAILTSAGSWEAVGYSAGSMIVLAVLLMWVTRVLLIKHPFKGVI